LSHKINKPPKPSRKQNDFFKNFESAKTARKRSTSKMALCADHEQSDQEQKRRNSGNKNLYRSITEAGWLVQPEQGKPGEQQIDGYQENGEDFNNGEEMALKICAGFFLRGNQKPEKSFISGAGSFT
jgi:hypothetical protein